jgi:hypothetical protein
MKSTFFSVVCVFCCGAVFGFENRAKYAKGPTRYTTSPTAQPSLTPSPTPSPTTSPLTSAQVQIKEQSKSLHGLEDSIAESMQRWAEWVEKADSHVMLLREGLSNAKGGSSNIRIRVQEALGQAASLMREAAAPGEIIGSNSSNASTHSRLRGLIRDASASGALALKLRSDAAAAEGRLRTLSDSVTLAAKNSIKVRGAALAAIRVAMSVAVQRMSSAGVSLNFTLSELSRQKALAARAATDAQAAEGAQRSSGEIIAAKSSAEYQAQAAVSIERLVSARLQHVAFLSTVVELLQSWVAAWQVRVADPMPFTNTSFPRLSEPGRSVLSPAVDAGAMDRHVSDLAASLIAPGSKLAALVNGVRAAQLAAQAAVDRANFEASRQLAGLGAVSPHEVCADDVDPSTCCCGGSRKRRAANFDIDADSVVSSGPVGSANIILAGPIAALSVQTTGTSSGDSGAAMPLVISAGQPVIGGPASGIIQLEVGTASAPAGTTSTLGVGLPAPVGSLPVPVALPTPPLLLASTSHDPEALAATQEAVSLSLPLSAPGIMILPGAGRPATGTATASGSLSLPLPVAPTGSEPIISPQPSPVTVAAATLALTTLTPGGSTTRDFPRFRDTHIYSTQAPSNVMPSTGKPSIMLRNMDATTAHSGSQALRGLLFPAASPTVGASSLSRSTLGTLGCNCGMKDALKVVAAGNAGNDDTCSCNTIDVDLLITCRSAAQRGAAASMHEASSFDPLAPPLTGLCRRLGEVDAAGAALFSIDAPVEAITVRTRRAVPSSMLVFSARRKRPEAKFAVLAPQP